MIKKTFFIPLLALTLFTGVAHAQSDNEPQAGLIPGNPLYILDVMSEGIGNLFTFNDVSKAERYLNQASERIAEARELANSGKSDRAVETTKKYEEKLAMAMDKADKAKENGKDTEALLEKIADATSRQQSVLADVLEKVPEQAKEAIQKAIEQSQKGRDKALEAVSGGKETGAQNDKNPTNTVPESSSVSTENKGQSTTNKPENVGRPQ